MATYLELYNLYGNEDLMNRVTIAVVIAAETIRNEDAETVNHDLRMVWAARALGNPHREARRMLWGALAQNAAATAQQISGATDAALQTAINNAVNMFAT